MQSVRIAPRRTKKHQEGALIQTKDITLGLSAVDDANNWLARSQYAPDPSFGGTIHEFRVYGVARTGAELEASASAGPDAPPTE